MPASTQLEPIYVDLTGAALLTTLSESTIEKMVREGQFPRPRVLSRQRIGYLRSEIVEWAHARPVVESFKGQAS